MFSHFPLLIVFSIQKRCLTSFIFNSDIDLKEQYRLVELKKMLSQYGMRSFHVSYAARAKVKRSYAFATKLERMKYICIEYTALPGGTPLLDSYFSVIAGLE